MIKKTGALLLSLVLVFTLAACSGNNNNNNNNNNNASSSSSPSDSVKSDPGKIDASEVKVKLRIYAQYADEDTKLPYDYAVAELKKEMPNVELELDIQAQDDNQKLKTYAATGNVPDIFQANLDIINTFKESGNILELDSYTNEYGFKDKVLPNAMNTFVMDDGHTWAFPYAGNEVALLYYNKEVFEQNGVNVPETYDELMDAVKTFKSKGIIPMSLFAKEKWPCVALYDMLATRNDIEGIKKLDQGKAKASDPAYKNAAERLNALVKEGLLPKGVTSMNYDQAVALFYEGKAAMFINGQWEIEAASKALGDKLGYMYYPAADAASVEKTKYAFSGSGGPGGYAVSAKSANKELAAKVAAFISLKYAEYKYTQKPTPIVATRVDKPVEKEVPEIPEATDRRHSEIDDDRVRMVSG